MLICDDLTTFFLLHFVEAFKALVPFTTGVIK